MKRLLLRISLFINIVALLIFIFAMPQFYEAQDNLYNIFHSLLIILCITIYLISSSKLYNNVVKYDLFFLLGFAIVHFQIPIAYSMGVRSKFTEFVILNKQLMNYLTWFSGVSILCWMIGVQFMSFYLFKKKKEISSNKFTKLVIRQPIADIFLIVVFIGFIAIAGKPLLSGVYDGGQSWGANATYFYMLLRAFLIVRVFYFFYKNKGTKPRALLFRLFQEKILVIVALSYILLFFIGGQRSSILELLILAICCYNIYIKKIRFFFIIIGVVIGGFIFTLLGMGRTADSKELTGNIIERGMEKFDNQGEVSFPTDELSGSNKISYIAVAFFPDKINYLYGKTMLMDAIGVIPFGSQIFFSNYGGLDSTSTLLFTYLDQGKNSTYGAGSDVLSDVYINFGIIGTFIIFFLFGGFISFIQFKFSMTNEFYWSLIAAAIIISAIFINRAQLLSPLKDVFYALVFAKIFFKKV